ncbi:hypothetical protein JTE90_008419 [Oedothorax gibbosus]|uniref:Uncharacterized protein n=1 Tax=Oedothorax gibbosus TaxID=931172 RepID=A0AAV6UUQ1_9ARAC|nr:hypothetical protein JTE90_008419 [Oedothorax gibbosus]
MFLLFSFLHLSALPSEFFEVRALLCVSFSCHLESGLKSTTSKVISAQDPVQPNLTLNNGGQRNSKNWPKKIGRSILLETLVVARSDERMDDSEFVEPRMSCHHGNEHRCLRIPIGFILKNMNSALYLTCLMVAGLVFVHAEECENDYSKVMCLGYCMLNGLSPDGKCRLVDGTEKCYCSEERTHTVVNIGEKKVFSC